MGVSDKAGAKDVGSASHVASPTVGTDGTIYVPTGGAYNCSVMALNMDGSTKWKFTVPRVSDALFMQHSFSPVTIGQNDLLYIPASDGNLWAVNIHTGTLQWRMKTMSGVS